MKQRTRSWQLDREMSPQVFLKMIELFGVSQAGMGRFLGCSERTVRRWVRGEIKIPVAEGLLLRSMLVHNEKPTVPNWKRGDS